MPIDRKQTVLYITLGILVAVAASILALMHVSPGANDPNSRNSQEDLIRLLPDARNRPELVLETEAANIHPLGSQPYASRISTGETTAEAPFGIAITFVDESYQPIEGVVLCHFSTTQDAVLKLATSDLKGTVQLEREYEGASLCAHHASHMPVEFTCSNGLQIIMKSGDRPITGSIKTTQGQPVPNVGVRLRRIISAPPMSRRAEFFFRSSGTHIASTVSDSQGLFRFDCVLPDADYLVSIVGDGVMLSERHMPSPVRSGENVDLQVQWLRGFLLKTIDASTGRAIEGVRINAVSRGRGQYFSYSISTIGRLSDEWHDRMRLFGDSYRKIIITSDSPPPFGETALHVFHYSYEPANIIITDSTLALISNQTSVLKLQPKQDLSRVEFRMAVGDSRRDCPIDRYAFTLTREGEQLLVTLTRDKNSGGWLPVDLPSGTWTVKMYKAPNLKLHLIPHGFQKVEITSPEMFGFSARIINENGDAIDFRYDLKSSKLRTIGYHRGDADREFLMVGLAEDKWSLTIEAPGYETREETLNLSTTHPFSRPTIRMSLR